MAVLTLQSRTFVKCELQLPCEADVANETFPILDPNVHLANVKVSARRRVSDNFSVATRLESIL